MGSIQQGMEYYEKFLEISRKIGDVKGEGMTLNNLGNVYEHRGELKEALKTTNKAFHHERSECLRVRRPTIWQICIWGWGRLRAEPFVKKSNTNASWGKLRLLQKDYPSAKTSYESLLKSAEQNRKADNLFIAYTGLGLSSEGMKEDEKATEYYRKAVDLTEELRSSLTPARESNSSM